MDNVDVRAFAMPERYMVAGKRKVPVVVMLDQGASPAANPDEALVPVGAGADEINGNGESGNSAARQGRTQGKRDDEKRFPVRMFHLVDVSGSMGDYPGTGDYNRTNTKLSLVQNTILRLADKLPEGIVHVLIPYSDDLHLSEGGNFNQVAALIEAVKKLVIHGGTNIGLPIEEALRQIKERPNNEEGIEYRNLINLVSDGQADTTIPLKLALTYPTRNAGAFSLGIGVDYNEHLMQGLVENAGFGSIAHIPSTGKHQAIDVFGAILPDVVSQMMSAPYYPVITFNKWFDSVINMNPSTRKAQENIGSDLHYYKAAVGYQNRGFAVGFIDENKFNEAKVHLELKESANKDPLTTQDLPIEDFETLGLDPKDVELLHKAPLEALKMQILKERNPEKIREFLEENPDLGEEFRKRLEALATQLEHYAAAGDENSSRGMTYSESGTFTAQTMGFNAFDLPLEALDDLANLSVSGKVADTVGGLAGDAYTQVAAFRNLPPREIVPVDKPAAKMLGEITLKIIPITPTLKTVKKGVVCDEFSINPNQSLDFGRAPNNDIVLQGPNADKISKQHGSFILDGEQLFIVDLDSTNGISINDGPNINPGELIRVRPEDIIKIANNTFRVSFEQAG